jgi:hypothetical protein
MILLVKLLLAHLLGDFVLQSNSWANDKATQKLKSVKLYYHFAVYTLCVFVIVWDWQLWKGLLLLLVFHYLVDIVKVLLQHNGNRVAWFIIDQILHLAAIVVFWLCVSAPQIDLKSIINEKTLVITTAIVFLTIPVSVIIRELTSKWADNLGENNSLKDAGKYIGMLERILIFIFIILNRWDAIGFLLAAKSVFRFGDLKEAKDLKLTEYMLIGTLLSFGIAIVTGLLVVGYQY